MNSTCRSRLTPFRWLALVLLVLPSLLTDALAAQITPAKPARYREDRIIIRLKHGKDSKLLNRVLGTKVKHALHHGGIDLEVLTLPGFAKQADILAQLRQNDAVQYAEPDYYLDALAEPNDFRFWDGSQWHLKNTGIYGGTVGADIHAPAAWDLQTSASNIIVAVVDSGIRTTHEDLQGNLWVNPGETGTDAFGHDKRTNGIDDDGDGYVDDVYGINAITGSGNPADDWGHGTNVAGIIGATTNNGVGCAGVAWQVKLMGLKFIDSTGNGTISDAIECLDYARTKGAKIVNASWGAYGFTSTALRDAITALRDAGIIFVAACGNSAGDNDSNPLYPASYEFDNILSVAATDRNDHAAFFTNWGHTTVDLAAPGSPIYSLWAGSDSDYRYMDGTSQAAPQVAGAAALVWAHYPTLTYRQVIQQIVTTTDPLADFAGKTVSGGRLNVARALATTPADLPPDDNPPPDDDPPPAQSDVIWVDDAIPAGAWTSTSGGDTWNWVSASPAPYSGAKAHQSALVSGYHDHTFQQATATMTVATGDKLFLYVYLDPANPPSEIMVSWFNGTWEHRAFWGQNLIPYGTYDTASRFCMGSLPAAGQWVRLEVPASSLALEGSTVSAMSFTLYDGRVTWDAAGRKTSSP